MSEFRLGSLTGWLAASPGERAAALTACLERIRILDPQIRAWVQVQPQLPSGDGRLSGIPFGVKDIIETAGLLTEYGSPLYRGRIGARDAAIVRDLRDRGALLLGKTVTTEFAYRAPPPTRNPANLAHTPGGSSSGSAAAVAADMAPFTVGEQTLGSILRPASYCGVTGFKPTYGVLSTDGVLPLAHSLDTLGFFTQTPEDMAALWEAMGHPAERLNEIALGLSADHEVEPVMETQFLDCVARLRAEGLTIRTIDIGSLIRKAATAGRTVFFYEAAQAHHAHWSERGSGLGELADVVREGLQIATETYQEALQIIAECRSQASNAFTDTPVILTPAATGPAPTGFGSTGDPRMNAPWTALGTPAISVPMPVGTRLPLGLQLVADRGQDARVLQAASLLANVLRNPSRPEQEPAR